jgi:hypothetical protein
MKDVVEAVAVDKADNVLFRIVRREGSLVIEGSHLNPDGSEAWQSYFETPSLWDALMALHEWARLKNLTVEIVHDSLKYRRIVLD